MDISTSFRLTLSVPGHYNTALLHCKVKLMNRLYKTPHVGSWHAGIIIEVQIFCEAFCGIDKTISTAE